ncbi:MAG: hypothetical protein JOY71_08220 [Acetobacteraceae bacterium]|nr:hypothetical protein [Acetobacteraceae bacterium]MBV8522097.1 hypothetical protein [Acetobacteraceae bacterium]
MSIEKKVAPDPEAKLSAPENTAEPISGICDIRFVAELRKLNALRWFEVQAATEHAATMPPSFGALRSLHYDPWGRPPSPAEWFELDRLTSDLLDRLPCSAKKAFTRSQIPAFFAHVLPLALLVMACWAASHSIYRLSHVQGAKPIGLDQIMASVQGDADTFFARGCRGNCGGTPEWLPGQLAKDWRIGLVYCRQPC